MDNEKIKNFITTQRQSGIPDSEIYAFLQSKGVIQQPQTPQQPKKDLLQKATDITTSIFPGGKVGESIGTLAGYALSKNKKNYDLSAPTPLQVVGDVAQGTLSIGGLKAPVAGTALGRVAQTAVLGGGLSGSESIAKGENAKEVLKDTAIGAVTGATLQGAFEGLPVLGKWLGNKANELRKSSLRLTPQDKLKLNSKLDDVVGYLKQEGISGNPAKQYEQITEKHNFAEKIVQSTVKESGKTYTRKELVDDILRLPEKYAGEFDNPEVYDQLTKKSERLADYIKNTFGSRYGDKIPAEKLNDLKRAYMKNAFNKAGDAVSNEANLTLGDELYKKLLTDVPSLETINKTYSNIITARKVLGKALGRNELGAFGNLVALGVGGGIGSALGGVPGAIVGTMVARPVATKVAGTAARTTYAKGAEKIGKNLVKSKGSKIPRLITTGINELGN